MTKGFSVFLILAWVFSTTACFETTLSNLASNPTAENPSPRLSEINAQLATIEQQKAQLRSDRALAETQRNESLLEMGKLTGMGPKAPSGMFGEDQALPGELITMHNANITVSIDKMKEIDAKTEALNQQANALKAERSKLEEAIAQSSRTSFAASGGCFTPDTPIRLPQGTKSIATVSVGDSLLVYDEESGDLTQRQILNVFRAREDHYFLINGDVRVTALHRFMTRDGWVRAKDLEPGMQLKTLDGWRMLESKKLIEATVEVVNMEVAEHHDFFVMGAKKGYLVHNCGGGGK